MAFKNRVRKILVFALIFTITLSSVFVHELLLPEIAYALPYAPGETLDPSCTPGSADCTVSGTTTAPAFIASNANGTSTFAGGLETKALNITSSTASSTFANGIHLTSGCFAINGTCVMGGGGGGVSLSDANTWTALQTFQAGFISQASSTASQLTVTRGTTTHATSTNMAVSSSLRLTALSDGCLSVASGLVSSSGSACASASQWTTTGSDIYYTTGNVAIGTSDTTSYPFKISDTDSSKILLTGGSSQNGMTFDNVGGGDEFYLYTSATGLEIYNNSDGRSELTFNNSGGIYTTNNVAIGTSDTSSYPFKISSTNSNKFLITGGSSQNGMEFAAVGGGDAFYTYTSSIGFAHYNNTDGRHDLVINNSGNIGVNTTGPDRRFDILDASNPQLRLTHTDGSVYADFQTNSSGNLTVTPSGGNFGIGTSSPGTPLSVTGAAVITGTTTAPVFTATSSLRASTFPYASTTALTVSGALYNSSLSNGCLNVTSGLVGSTGSDCGSGGSAPAGFTGWTTHYAADGSTLTATSTLFLGLNGKVGVGSSTPWSKFAIGNHGASTQFPLFAVGSSSASIATSTLFVIDWNGNVGVGTTSPYAKLSVTGTTTSTAFHATDANSTSTFAGGLSVANGAILHDFSAGVTSIDNLALGSMWFDTDAGIISWADMPVTSSATAGTVESYSANIDGNPILTVYAESDGAGGIRNTRVGIGTSSPYSMLAVAGTTTAQNFVATSTTKASWFPLASTTALTVSGTSGLTLSALSDGCMSVTLGVVGSTGSACGSGGGVQGYTGWTTHYAADGTTLTATSTLTLALSSKVGVGSSTPWAKFGIGSHGAGTVFPLFAIGSSSASVATSTLFVVDWNGNVGIGTTSPYAKLSVNGTTTALAFHATDSNSTSTFNGGLNVGSGALMYDFSSGVTSIDNLELGALSFDTNAGMVSWMDMPVTSSAADGTVESYTASIDGTPLLTVYAQSDGVGNIKKSGVGIGTTTPYARLTVWGTSTSALGQALEVSNQASSTLLVVKDDGKVGISTTTPWRTLSVTGTAAFNGLTSSSAGNAVCITAGKEITDAGAAACNGVSSQRFKTDILDTDLGLETIMELRPVSFKYKEGFGDSGKVQQFGLIAEEAYAVDSRLAVLDAEGMPTTVRYDFLAPMLVKAVQELNLKIDALKTNSNGQIVIEGTSESLASVILGFFDDIGGTVVDGVLNLKDLVVGNLTIGSKEKPSGITLYDEETKDPYCLKIVKGVATSTPGVCTATSTQETDTETQTSTPPVEDTEDDVIITPAEVVNPEPLPDPEVTSTSTPETTSIVEDPTQTPEPTPEAESVTTPEETTPEPEQTPSAESQAPQTPEETSGTPE